MGIYKNPLRRAHLTPERIDQGVDYSGSGPIYALGPGVIRSVTNAGWPGGAFIVEQLTSGPDAGAYTYYAENISPSVRTGQVVSANDVVGNIHGGIEVGWAAGPPHIGESLAMERGQAAHSGDAGSVSTGTGVSFNDLLKSLGAPGGKLQGKVSGSVANPSGGGSASPGGGSSNPLSALSFGNIGNDLLSGILGAVGVPNLSDLLERAALILVGSIFIIIGLWNVQSDQTKRREKEAAGAAVMVAK